MSEEMIATRAFDRKGFEQRVRAHLNNDLSANGRITADGIDMIGAEAEFYAKRFAYNPNERLREASSLADRLERNLPSLFHVSARWASVNYRKENHMTQLTPITLVAPCPPHEWAHAPTVGYFRCSKCGEQIDYKDPRYGEMLNARGAGKA